MSTALLFSLMLHALLLSLAFGSQGFGLPGLDFPWRERRFEAGDLHVSLVPTQVTAATPVLIKPSTPLMPTGMVRPAPIAAPGALAVMSQSPVVESESIAFQPTPAPDLIASERPDTANKMTVTPAVPISEIAAAPSITSPAVVIPTPRDTNDIAQKQIDPALQERALELPQLNRAKQEAERLEAARLDAERQEVTRQAVARKEAAQVEAANLAAAQQAAVRQETERLATARVDAGRQEAERQEAARQERERQVAARVEQDAKREAVLQAIGKQLNEEADRRDAARSSSASLASSGTARRGRLFGRTDPNTELILYAEAWARKIELNMTIDMVREAAKQRHTNPLVTVALRSDGSVESVTFVVSSGVAEIDAAIRRIVQSQAPYPSFPPGLTREYDVIEIRRNWSFDMAVRLF